MSYSLIDTDTIWDNKIDTYTVYTNNNDYTVNKTLLGAYDEDGNETIGTAGLIEIIKNQDNTDSAIYTILTNKNIEASDNTDNISIRIESDPNDFEQTFEEVIKIIEFVA